MDHRAIIVSAVIEAIHINLPLHRDLALFDGVTRRPIINVVVVVVYFDTDFVLSRVAHIICVHEKIVNARIPFDDTAARYLCGKRGDVIAVNAFLPFVGGNGDFTRLHGVRLFVSVRRQLVVRVFGLFCAEQICAGILEYTAVENGICERYLTSVDSRIPREFDGALFRLIGSVVNEFFFQPFDRNFFRQDFQNGAHVFGQFVIRLVLLVLRSQLVEKELYRNVRPACIYPVAVIR